MNWTDVKSVVYNMDFICLSLQVHHVRLFAGEDIYSDLYLTVCEWHNDHSKLVVFGFK